MRKYWLWLLIVAVVGVWAGNLWYYNAQKLEKPLFLKHYYEVQGSLVNGMHLYFITNKDSNRVPVQIVFADGVYLYVEHTQIRDEQGRLQLLEVSLRPTQQQLFEQLTEQITVDQLQVYYNDGLVDTVPIGKIIVHPKPSKRYPLYSHSSSGSSDGTGSAGYNVSRDMTIHSVTTSFPELLNGTVEVEFNGNMASDPGSFPLNLRAGESTDMKYRIKLPNDDIRRYNAYNLMFTYVEAGSGEHAGVHYVNVQPRLYEDQLAKYVRLRKGEKQP